MKVRTKLAVMVACVLALAIAVPSATAAMTKADYKKECEAHGGQYTDHGTHVTCLAPNTSEPGSLCMATAGTKKGTLKGNEICI